MATVRGSPRSPAAHAGRRLGGRGARSWRARGAPRPGGTRTEVDERSAGVRCQARRRGRARMDHRPLYTQLDGSMRLAARRGEKRCTLSRALALASRGQRERGDGRRLALDRVSEHVQYRQHSFPRRRRAAGRRGPPIGKAPMHALGGPERCNGQLLVLSPPLQLERFRGASASIRLRRARPAPLVLQRGDPLARGARLALGAQLGVPNSERRLEAVAPPRRRHSAPFSMDKTDARSRPSFPCLTRSAAPRTAPRRAPRAAPRASRSSVARSAAPRASPRRRC